MIGVILGTGFLPFEEAVENPTFTDYQDIPGFPSGKANGHRGRFVHGHIRGHEVAVMNGRFHAYEGYDETHLEAPVRFLRDIGCDKLILTNASGGVNLSYRVGDLMVIADQIKLTGRPALIGAEFFDMTGAYDPDLRKLALRIGRDAGLRIHEGIYFYMPGPQFETPAEIRAIRILGGDAVGMSTVFDAIAASRYHIPTVGLSLITNMAAGITGKKTTGSEVDQTAAQSADHVCRYMESLIEEME